MRLRANQAKRGAHERPLGEIPVAGGAGEPADLLAWSDLAPVLDGEVNRLPVKYRDAFVLCCLEGKSTEEAADQLGCPRGTVMSRLGRARERLRRRLLHKGLALAAAPFVLLLQNARALAEVSPVLVNATVQTGVALTLSQALGPLASARAVALAEEILRGLGTRGGLWATLLLVLLLFLGAAAGVAAYEALRSPTAPTPVRPACHGGDEAP
jgi:hypothetical protein